MVSRESKGPGRDSTGVHRLAHVSLGQIIDMLSHAVGNEKAESAVLGAARDLGYTPGAILDTNQSLALLEKVAETPGIVGVAARFAKSRVHLLGKTR